MNLDEIKSKFAGLERDIQCAFCLNPAASNQKVIQGKTTYDGKEAVAFLCDDHKDQEPKFAHLVSDTGRITTVPVEDLQGTGAEHNLGVQSQKPTLLQDQLDQSTEAKAKRIASDVKQDA